MKVRPTVNIKVSVVPWTHYIVISAKSWYRPPQPNPETLAAVPQGCTNMLGSGRAVIAADVTAAL
jgi:hypothetical protein